MFYSIYEFIKQNVSTVYLNFGSYLAAKQRYILLAANMVSNTAQDFTPQEFWTNRRVIADKMLTKIKKVLLDDGSVNVTRFEMLKIDFASQFEDAITQVQVAEQQKVVNEYDQKVQTVQQRIDVLQAENQAHITAISSNAEGVARQQVANATRDGFNMRQGMKATKYAQLQRALGFDEAQMSEYFKIKSIQGQESKSGKIIVGVPSVVGARAEAAERELQQLKAGAVAPSPAEPPRQAVPQDLAGEERASLTAEIARLRGELEQSRASPEATRAAGRERSSPSCGCSTRPTTGTPGTERGAQGDEALRQLQIDVQRERDAWRAERQHYEQRLELAAGAHRELERRLGAADAAAGEAPPRPAGPGPGRGGAGTSFGAPEELHGFSQKMFVKSSVPSHPRGQRRLAFKAKGVWSDSYRLGSTGYGNDLNVSSDSEVCVLFHLHFDAEGVVESTPNIPGQAEWTIS
ncbi:unnamed protein product [Prorocentrum cordatum]|uniref:Band 7 domain-containing protein n=1 Tax=Prorocentrum cordatum TaxID=2364126 RepID=A0ABN9SNV5_9DINO|nr:unnamed protein product [Polarella glacialis]